MAYVGPNPLWMKYLKPNYNFGSFEEVLNDIVNEEYQILMVNYLRCRMVKWSGMSNSSGFTFQVLLLLSIHRFR